MQREIKFRAWDKRDKRWATYRDSDGAWMYLLEGKLISVKDVEVMQYTGLKDKNGKDEYEGDVETAIFTDDDGKEKKVRGAIVFAYGRFELQWGTSHLELNRMWQREVIGNIWENSDLLTSKE